MKPYFLVLLVTVLLGSCGNNSTENTAKKQENMVSLFLNYPEKFGDEKGNPIEEFTKRATADAHKSIKLTPDNIADALKKAQKYTYAVVVAGNHTIVRLVDFEDCQQSGSWGACMPKGKGYIKRGEMESQNDYINNLIGKPDNQNRMLYLFK